MGWAKQYETISQVLLELGVRNELWFIRKVVSEIRGALVEFQFLPEADGFIGIFVFAGTVPNRRGQ